MLAINSIFLPEIEFMLAKMGAERIKSACGCLVFSVARIPLRCLGCVAITQANGAPGSLIGLLAIVKFGP